MGTKVAEQQSGGAGVARLTNVGTALTAMKQIQNATPQMPRIAVLSGAPGMGKSSAAMHLAHPGGVNAVYMSLRPFDTMKTLAQGLATELDIRWKTGWSVAALFEATTERLATIGRPLLIDEVDYIAEKSSIDYIRSIHDQINVPIFLIGEERLQAKLLRHHERFHDRVLVWANAIPCDLDDAELLARHYAPQLTWEPEACKALVTLTNGVARRITTEVERIREQCSRSAITSVSAGMVGAPVKGRR